MLNGYKTIVQSEHAAYWLHKSQARRNLECKLYPQYLAVRKGNSALLTQDSLIASQNFMILISIDISMNAIFVW